jgi:hypothetical protein
VPPEGPVSPSGTLRATPRSGVALTAPIPRPCLLAGVSLLLLATASEAGAGVLHFAHLGPEDGLAHNTANALLQDRQGFLWIATDDGLDRYDGYQFRALPGRPGPRRQQRLHGGPRGSLGDALGGGA